MGTGNLTINLKGIANNWRILDTISDDQVETAAVVKADGYGLNAGRIARSLYEVGARVFFVAAAEEAAAVRQSIGDNATICVFSGHMSGDTEMIHDLHLIPMLNSFDQLTRHLETLPGHPFGIQLDTGMNRLGMKAVEWDAVRDTVVSLKPWLVMSHLACADEPENLMNKRQLEVFKDMTDGFGLRRSLAATGGILLGPEYHFDLTRPGIGLYGGAPFVDANPVMRLSLPVIQIHDLTAGETVGYGGSWTAPAPARIATIAAGYADGLLRSISKTGRVWYDNIACPIAGRVSMDLIGVDITHLEENPEALDILSNYQTIDQLAESANTIGYEILTSIGSRYTRRYVHQ